MKIGGFLNSSGWISIRVGIEDYFHGFCTGIRGYKSSQILRKRI